MMDFPITDLRDEHACDQWLLGLFHPEGLACPRCGGTAAYVHRFFREPVRDYRCKDCGKVYNAFTGPEWQKTHFRPSQVVLTVRGFAQGRTTAGLARELGASRGHLLERRHRIQAHALAAAEVGGHPAAGRHRRGRRGVPERGEKGRL